MNQILLTVFMMVAQAPDPKVLEPKVTVTPAVSVQACRLLKLSAETNGKQIKWIAPASVDLIVSESGKWAVFQSLKPGIFQVAVYTALGDVPSEPAIITVTVTGLPDPAPTPDPIVPPVPTPTPLPDPNSLEEIKKDPLYLKLSPIYAAISDTNKLDQKNKLIIIYQQAIVVLQKYEFGSASDFIAQTHIIAAQYLAPTALKAMRTTIGEELNSILPTDPNVKLDKATVELCQKQFTRIIKILETIK